MKTTRGHGLLLRCAWAVCIGMQAAVTGRVQIVYASACQHESWMERKGVAWAKVGCHTFHGMWAWPCRWTWSRGDEIVVSGAWLEKWETHSSK